jgi:hypothetical protein
LPILGHLFAYVCVFLLFVHIFAYFCLFITYFCLFLPIFWLRARSSTNPPSADEKEVDEKEAFGPKAGRKFVCHVG